MKEYLEAGKIINKRGLSGELKIESYCDSPQAFCSFKRVFLDRDGKDERSVISAKIYKGYVYLKIDGVSDPEEADRLRGKSLYIFRNDVHIGEGRIFIDDIIGLQVKDADTGEVYGVLKDVFNSGASDILSIDRNGKEYLIPSVDEIVVSIDTESGVLIRPIPGLIDDAEEIK